MLNLVSNAEKSEQDAETAVFLEPEQAPMPVSASALHFMAVSEFERRQPKSERRERFTPKAIGWHARQARQKFFQLLAIKAAGHARSVEKMTAQMIMTTIFGTSALLWSEIATYLGLRTVLAPQWCALLVLFANVAALLVMGAAYESWKKSFAREQAFAAENQKNEAKAELEMARGEVLQLAKEVVAPLKPYKKHLVIGCGFLIGFWISKAVFRDFRDDDSSRN